MVDFMIESRMRKHEDRVKTGVSCLTPRTKNISVLMALIGCDCVTTVYKPLMDKDKGYGNIHW